MVCYPWLLAKVKSVLSIVTQLGSILNLSQPLLSLFIDVEYGLQYREQVSLLRLIDIQLDIKNSSSFYKWNIESINKLTKLVIVLLIETDNKNQNKMEMWRGVAISNAINFVF